MADIRTWWLLAAPLCFAVALAIATFRRRSVEELRERDERRAEHSRERAERKARRAAGLPTRARASASSNSVVTSPATPC